MQQKQGIDFQKHNLILYKNKPGRILSIADKIEIELEKKEVLKVRPKDIEFLHHGPCMNLEDLTPLKEGDIFLAAELLQGQTTTLSELSQLIYGEFTPKTAWAVYQLVLDGSLFFGSTDAILIRTKQEYDSVMQQRIKKTEEKQDWNLFIERVKNNAILETDSKYLKELEQYACEKTQNSKILAACSLQATPSNAHKLLLKLSYWSPSVNPHTARHGFSVSQNYPSLGVPKEEQRIDLTYLPAYAIDDEGNKDPDDAISIEGNNIWVHVADVASLVQPGTEADTYACNHGSNLYIPEATIHMLPPQATEFFGLGLAQVSPALSFCIRLHESGAIEDVSIMTSNVRVQRITYEQAQQRMDSIEFSDLYSLLQKYRAYRKARNALFLSFPEVKIRVIQNRVSIKELPALQSRELVAEAMILAGEATALYAQKQTIPFPYTTQEPPDVYENPQDLAGMFGYRKQLKPSQLSCYPKPHSCLGLPAYVRVTSPLRRSIDLIAHQQIRASLGKNAALTEQDIIAKIGTYNAIIGSIHKTEYLSNQHWTLVYLMQNPEWNGEGIVVEKQERFSIVLIPSLAFEARLSLAKEYPLNSKILLKVASIDLPELRAHFQLVS